MAEANALLDRLREVIPAPTAAAKAALAPTGVLRAGINMSNFLLVTSGPNQLPPEGVSPGIAAALASMLECPVEYVPFPSPGAVADAVQDDAWDIGNIGADPARAEFINFTDAYCEIESTCLLPGDSPIKDFVGVDQPGIRIASKARAAYTLWLERNLEHASLRLFDSIDASYEGFIEQRLDVLAGLRPRLLEDSARTPGSRLLPGKFAAVQQAIGTPSGRDPAGAAFLSQFVSGAKSVGLVQALIKRHGVDGKLSVAP